MTKKYQTFSSISNWNVDNDGFFFLHSSVLILNHKWHCVRVAKMEFHGADDCKSSIRCFCSNLHQYFICDGREKKNTLRYGNSTPSPSLAWSIFTSLPISIRCHWFTIHCLHLIEQKHWKHTKTIQLHTKLILFYAPSSFVLDVRF